MPCFSNIITFTFTHLADAFIQSELQCIKVIHFFLSLCVPWELNPRPFALLTQCSTTEPQEQSNTAESVIDRVISKHYSVYQSAMLLKYTFSTKS